MNELVDTGSRLIDGMDPQYWGDTPRQIEVLEIGYFIDQLIQLHERGDTVIVAGLYTGNDHGPIYANTVSDWSLETRKEINDSFRKYAPLLAHEPEPPRGHISRQKAEEKVGSVMASLVNVELYSQLNKAQRLVELFRCMRGKQSLFEGYSEYLDSIPDYISYNSNAAPEGRVAANSQLILVNAESEKAYVQRSGKFSYW